MPSTPPAEMPAAPLEGLHLLLVEDNPVNQRLSQALIEAAGGQAELVATGAAGVARVAQGGVDVVLMDLQLPDMDGLAAARAMRALPVDQPAIVAATAAAYAERGSECLSAGMDAFLEKPVGFERLVDAVASLTGRPAGNAALRNFGGSAAAWRAAMAAFAHLYAEGLPSLRAACDGDAAALRRLHGELHALAGACAALGAIDLQARASACEALLLHAPAQATASLVALQTTLQRRARSAGRSMAAR